MLANQQLRCICFTSVIVVLLRIVYSFELPFLQTCTIDDEKCHVEQINKFFELYANGIPELNISTFDPMPVGDVHIKGNPNENSNLEVFMDNMIVYKFPLLKCLSIKGFTNDIDKPQNLILKIFLPKLINRSRCRIKGKILLFELVGETDTEINMKNLTSTLRVKCQTYTKDGKMYYRVDKLKPHLDIGSLSIIFGNSTLFNGEQIFMDTFAETINQNWEIFRDEVEPHLNKAFNRVALDVFNKILATIPLDKWFKPSEG